MPAMKSMRVMGMHLSFILQDIVQIDRILSDPSEMSYSGFMLFNTKMTLHSYKNRTAERVLR